MSVSFILNFRQLSSFSNAGFFLNGFADVIRGELASKLGLLPTIIEVLFMGVLSLFVFYSVDSSAVELDILGKSCGLLSLLKKGCLRASVAVILVL